MASDHTMAKPMAHHKRPISATMSGVKYRPKDRPIVAWPNLRINGKL